MSLGLIALIVLVLVLVLLGVLPTWGHSRSWGYGPSPDRGGGDRAAIVRWAGTLSVASTRNATSSCSFLAILRELKTPVA